MFKSANNTTYKKYCSSVDPSNLSNRHNLTDITKKEKLLPSWMFKSENNTYKDKQRVPKYIPEDFVGEQDQNELLQYSDKQNMCLTKNLAKYISAQKARSLIEHKDHTISYTAKSIASFKQNNFQHKSVDKSYIKNSFYDKYLNKESIPAALLDLKTSDDEKFKKEIKNNTEMSYKNSNKYSNFRQNNDLFNKTDANFSTESDRKQRVNLFEKSYDIPENNYNSLYVSKMINKAYSTGRHRIKSNASTSPEKLFEKKTPFSFNTNDSKKINQNALISKNVQSLLKYNNILKKNQTVLGGSPNLKEYKKNLNNYTSDQNYEEKSEKSNKNTVFNNNE